ncbi:type IV toxin-antitoxin system AbiEi family antitoxin domain-containing protein [Candidatus Pyrohabitans sp.]
MKTIEVVLREFPLRGKRFLTSKELEEVCKRYGLDGLTTKKVLLNKGYLVRIFRGIFYLKDYNEHRTGVLRYSAPELLAEGLGFKGVKNWYFGLNTALKMLNLTHEVFRVSYVLNDSFNRVKPLSIAGSDFFFIRIKPKLFSFGIKDVRTSSGITLRHSDLEKTLLDMIYLSRRSGRDIAETVLDEYGKDASPEVLLSYARHYPSTVEKTVSVWVERRWRS